MGFVWEPRRRASEERLARLQRLVESLDSYPPAPLMFFLDFALRDNVLEVAVGLV